MAVRRNKTAKTPRANAKAAAKRSEKRAAKDSPGARKLIAFDRDVWRALDLLARDRMADIQDLADEAFADLLKKHHRPTSLKAALKESARRLPANDGGRTGRGK